MSTLAILARHEARRASKSVIPRLIFVAMAVGLASFLRNTWDVASFLVDTNGVDGSQQVVPGMGVLFAFVVLIYYGYTAFDDFGFGMWDRLRVSGVSSFSTLTAKGIVMGVHVVLHLALVFAFGALILSLDVAGPWWMIVVLILATAVAAVSYAFMAFSLSGSNALYNAFCYVGALAMTALGGGLVPFPLLPDWAQTIGPATPTYWAVQGFRHVLTGTASISLLLGHVAMLLLFAAVFLGIGVWRYNPDADREAFAL